VGYRKSKAVLQRGPGGAHDISVHQCRRCRRYERPSESSSTGRYEYHEPESPELLALCLKHIPALQHSKGGEQHAKSVGVGRIHVVDAMWVWTEPHSMRLKVRLMVRAEVEGGGLGAGGGVTVQQRVMVELVVKFKQCAECNREFTNRTWHAVVQLRQKRTDGAQRKGLILLETALSKNAAVRKNVLSMETTRHGFDFYFLSLMHAKVFASYLAKVCPMRIKTTQKLVSSDVKNNTANMKHTVSCDMVPLCRDDLIIVDKHAAHAGGGAGRLSGRMCLVNKVSSAIQLIDASPARSISTEEAFAEVPADKYWKGGEDKSYRILFSSKRLCRFVVLDVELCSGGNGGDGRHHDSESQSYNGPQSGVGKYALADVEVAREADFGQSDQTYRCVTHLGHLLQVGDIALGYDLVNSVLPSDAEWSMENSLNSSCVLPDVVLVKKCKGGAVESNDGDDIEETKEEKSKSRAKSSGSKRRERRRKREEKKMKALEDAAARMGFLEDDGAADESLIENDRSAFKEELVNDPELARELERAERELAQVQQDLTPQQEDVIESEES